MHAVLAFPPLRAVANAGSIQGYDHVELFRNSVLVQCIARADRSLEVCADALTAADAQAQFGETSDVHAYGKAVELAGQWLHKNYPSRSGSGRQLMKRIDFYYSPELEALAGKFLPR